jgi:hypothetical protein
MRGLLRVAAMALVTLVATSCATTMTVSSHVERGLDFRQYRTYDWGPADALPTGDARLDKNPFFKDHMQGAVETALAAKGLELTRSESPDLLIHYHANVTRRIDVNSLDRTYGYCNGADCPTDRMEFEAGTLVLDFIDTRTNRLVFRAWAQNHLQDILKDSDSMAKTIDEAVTRMILRLPRTPVAEPR